MDEKDLKNIGVNVTVVADENTYHGAKLCVIRALSLTLTDEANGYADVVVVLNDNAQDNHLVKLPANKVGRLMQAAGVNMWEDLPGRLLYAVNLEERPILVNPFIYAAVRCHPAEPAPVQQDENQHEQGIEPAHVH